MVQMLRNIVQIAEAFARAAHAGVTRRDGAPYITHPAAVARMLQDMGASDTVIAAAWLHDVVEDTSWTIFDLLLVFPFEVVEIVDAVTHIDGEEYQEGIYRTCMVPGAVMVKLADNLHNSHPDQLSVFPFPDQIRRTCKYAAARTPLYRALYAQM